MPFNDTAPLSIKSNKKDKKDKIMEQKEKSPSPTMTSTSTVENTEMPLNPLSSSASTNLANLQGNNSESAVLEKSKETSSDSRTKSKVLPLDERARRIEACRFLARKILKRC